MAPLTFTTPRTARYHSLGTAGPDIRHVWVCLHGHDQTLADFAAQLLALDTPERLLILPEALGRHPLPAPDGPPVAGASALAGRTGAAWFAPDSLLDDFADLTAYLENLTTQVLAACPPGTPLTVLGYGHGAAAACRWLAASALPYDRLILYAAVFPPEVDRRATLVALPERPVQVVASVTATYTPEAAGEGLLQDLRDAGLPARLRLVDAGPLTLAALG